MTVAQDDQTDPSLATRVAIANNAGNVDLFVSIHANAFGDGWNSANGWEVYTYQSGGIAEMAAKAVEQATIDSGAGLKNRGCKTANFYVIKNTTMPAILIEHGFYTNLEECEKAEIRQFPGYSRAGGCQRHHEFLQPLPVRGTSPAVYHPDKTDRRKTGHIKARI